MPGDATQTRLSIFSGESGDACHGGCDLREANLPTQARGIWRDPGCNAYYGNPGEQADEPVPGTGICGELSSQEHLAGATVASTVRQERGYRQSRQYEGSELHETFIIQPPRLALDVLVGAVVAMFLVIIFQAVHDRISSTNNPRINSEDDKGTQQNRDIHPRGRRQVPPFGCRKRRGVLASNLRSLSRKVKGKENGKSN